MQHETIHATIKARDVDIVSSKIQIGNVYEIRRFFVDQSKQKYKVVPHGAMLQFTRATTFVVITHDTPSIPLHKFNFIEFDQLSSRIEDNHILSGNNLNYFICTNSILLNYIFYYLYLQTNVSFISDVIGVLTSIQSLEKSYINNRMTSRKTMTIQNIR